MRIRPRLNILFKSIRQVSKLLTQYSGEAQSLGSVNLKTLIKQELYENTSTVDGVAAGKILKL